MNFWAVFGICFLCVCILTFLICAIIIAYSTHYIYKREKELDAQFNAIMSKFTVSKNKSDNNGTDW